MMMISIPKITGWPTSLHAWRTSSIRSTDCDRCSDRWRYTFSTTTTDPSTIMPIAMAKPPRDMRLAVRPALPMTMNVTSGVRTRVAVTIKALRTLPRNRKRMTTTRTIPSTNAL